jgi:ATP phosphoribosyltransferase
VLAARGKRYLMANVPRRVLPNVREVLPGLNGPTVVDVQGGDFVAVHAVVPAKTIYRTINALKDPGLRGHPRHPHREADAVSATGRCKYQGR